MGHIYEMFNVNSSSVVEKKERMKSLARGHVKDNGSTMGIQSCRGHGYDGAMSGDCFANSRHLQMK